MLTSDNHIKTQCFQFFATANLYHLKVSRTHSTTKNKARKVIKEK